MQNEIFFQVPNFVDQAIVIVMSIILVGLVTFAAEIWLWIIAELGILIYERIMTRVHNVRLRLSV